LGVDPGWPAERPSNFDLATIYAGAIETGNPGAEATGKAGNGNVGNNKGKGKSSNNNGNGNGSSGNRNGRFLNGGSANFTDALGKDLHTPCQH